MTDATASTKDRRINHGYVLDEQIGYLLRKAWQRNTVIFTDKIIEGLTPTQFAVMYRLSEVGSVSQNQLGRSVAMDGATTKGVIDRLLARNLVQTRPDPDDRRRHLISLTQVGWRLFEKVVMIAHDVSAETLTPLTQTEQRTLIRLLSKLQ